LSIMDPLDTALDSLEKLGSTKKRDLHKKQKKELEMWQTWDTGGRKPEDLRPLLKSLQPFLNREMFTYKRRLRDIPPDVIEAEFQDRLVDGLAGYDPNRGAKLNTHLRYRLMPARRFVTTYQNVGRIMESRVGGITPIKDATDKLTRNLGRSPSSEELAKEMTKSTDKTWTPGAVGMLRKELRKAYPTGLVGGEIGTITPSRDMQIMKLLPYELDADEKKVFNRVYGRGGSPQLGTNDIAKQLGISAPKVSRMKRRIAEKWKKYSG